MMLLSLFLNLILFSGLIPKANTHKMNAKTIIYDDHENVPEKSLNALFIKLTEFALTEDIHNEDFSINMNLTNSSTNKIVYEKFFPVTRVNKVNENEEWYNTFLILKSKENLEISFQVRYNYEISEIVTIPFPELNKNVPVSINLTKSPNMTFNLLITTATYFDRLSQVNLASNDYIYTKMPLNNQLYAFMNLKSNISIVQTINAVSEYQPFPPFDYPEFNASQTFYEVTVAKINYYNEEDPNESSIFELEFYLNINSNKYITGLRTLRLSKREYTQSELNLTDFKMSMDLSDWYFLTFKVNVVQLDENGNIVNNVGNFELNETEINEIRDQSEVTFTSSNNFSLILKFSSIKSTYVCFKPHDIKKYNNVSILTTVESIEITEKNGFFEFSVDKGEKYKIVVVSCENTDFLGLKFYSYFKEMSVFHYTTGKMVEITASSKPGDISIVDWDTNALAIFLKRDKTDEKKYKVQYLFGNNTDSDIKFFEDEEKNNKNKVKKYIYLALIIVGVISILISLYCIGRKCSKHCCGGDASSGLL